jgi:RNA recognition motif-containing protein
MDVVALKTKKMRGQAFVVFTELHSATNAVRAANGVALYGRPMVAPLPSTIITYSVCDDSDSPILPAVLPAAPASQPLLMTSDRKALPLSSFDCQDRSTDQSRYPSSG